ncbi:hypothetical protein [Candidatus Hydrogenosomobacter endosymbioticus]|uniref:DUF3168 domain-containing protein n=1 Tax=Candidatus Hydrogenosomobacter endosymbioticus TaxID=2558174 RepID=A0ABM7V835_9PROT|nr:hypothetical protein [Candidatus Hydrogenosomobacter endosymbioticus]BDB95915.1 hypothetical protein HYD_0480 [Candidatus Hydrogenosomobacter endosymbioticus]
MIISDRWFDEVYAYIGSKSTAPLVTRKYKDGYPYVYMEKQTSEYAFDRIGASVHFTIFSDYDGEKEEREIEEAIINAICKSVSLGKYVVTMKVDKIVPKVMDATKVRQKTVMCKCFIKVLV